MSEQVRATGPFRRVAAIVGVAGAVAAGAYGVSMVSASAQTPTTKAPSTTTPAKPKADDPNCPNMGGERGGYHTHGSAPSSTPANVPV